VKAELVQQRRHVVLHRLLRQEELDADLAIGQLVCNELEDAAFLRAQRGKAGMLGLAASPEAINYHGRRPSLEQGPSRGNGANSVNQVVATDLLKQVTGRPGHDHTKSASSSENEVSIRQAGGGDTVERTSRHTDTPRHRAAVHRESRHQGAAPESGPAPERRCRPGPPP
jgi:hypothetical protein